jgi:pimeloyl-ACP methyl ester carboxylesterase
MNQYLFTFFASLTALLLIGCGDKLPTPRERMQTSEQLTFSSQLKKHIYPTSHFKIMSYRSNTTVCKDDNLHVYIEGDGLAWVSSQTISDNPTPLNPLALKLALHDDHTCIVYLSRPCQYVDDETCSPKYWTTHRYSPEVLESFNDVFNILKTDYRVSSFNLYGYSGGGTIATLLSAQRDDIKQLITVSGNLDTEFWTRHHYLTPLAGSLNPADFSDSLAKIDQCHLIGGKDKIVDETIFDSYLSHFQEKQNIHRKVFNEFTHHCCWDQYWKEILEEIDKMKE